MAMAQVMVPEAEQAPVVLRLVVPAPEIASWRRGASLTQRRAARARAVRRRRRSLVGAALVAGLVMLAWPGHAFGGENSVGLSTDLATSSVLSAGMDYVVQPGDTIGTIARLVNPVTPALARRALVRELGSAVVVPGEHVIVP
ncbi:MAG: hypothetical protein ACP5PB_03890 [Acidimicrobiales bacterium]